MSHVSIVTAAAAFSMSAVLMAGPKFVSTWKAPDAAGVSFTGKKVAALIMSDDLNLRMSGEEALVRELAAVGVPAGVASYRIVPKEELRDPDKAKGWYERAGVEGVVAMRLVSSDKQQTWTPSMWVTSSYSTLWGYYGYGWTSVYAVGGHHPRRHDRGHRKPHLQRAAEQAALGGRHGEHQPEECRRGHQGHRDGKRQGDDQGRPDPPQVG